jgi:predicted nucleic acid-binding protein
MDVVLDASGALPWCFRDEASPATDQLFEMALAGVRLFVPAHWPTEILSSLTKAARLGRLDDTRVNSFLEQLPSFEIVVDLEPMSRLWAQCLPLIRLYQLSA